MGRTRYPHNVIGPTLVVNVICICFSTHPPPHHIGFRQCFWDGNGLLRFVTWYLPTAVSHNVVLA